MAPGTQPHIHNTVTSNMEPHPLSSTAKGGKNIQINALKKLISFSISLKLNYAFSISLKFSIFKFFKKASIPSKCSFTRPPPNSNTLSAKPLKKSRS